MSMAEHSRTVSRSPYLLQKRLIISFRRRRDWIVLIVTGLSTATSSLPICWSVGTAISYSPTLGLRKFLRGQPISPALERVSGRHNICPLSRELAGRHRQSTGVATFTRLGSCCFI